MDKDELRKLIKEIILEVLQENPQMTSVKADLIPLDEAFDKILHKFYRKGYLYELVMKDKIPHQKIGKHTYFSITELNEWLKNKKPKNK